MKHKTVAVLFAAVLLTGCATMTPVPTVAPTPEAPRVLRVMTYSSFDISEQVVAEFEASQKQPGKRLEIDELGGHWLFGVKAEGVRLITEPPPKLGAAAGEAPRPKVMAVDSLKLSVGLLRRLFGTWAVSYEAEVGGGVIEGTFFQNAEGARIVASAKDVGVAEGAGHEHGHSPRRAGGAQGLLGAPPRGGPGRRRYLHRLDARRSSAAIRARHRRRCSRTHYRMPLRPGIGDTDVDYGRRRTRSAGGRPDQKRRSP